MSQSQQITEHICDFLSHMYFFFRGELRQSCFDFSLPLEDLCYFSYLSHHRHHNIARCVILLPSSFFYERAHQFSCFLQSQILLFFSFHYRPQLQYTCLTCLIICELIQQQYSDIRQSIMGNKSTVEVKGIQPIGDLNNYLSENKRETEDMSSSERKESNKKCKTPEKVRFDPLSQITEVDPAQETQNSGLKLEGKKKVLPSVKPPRKMLIKRTKETKQNTWEEEQIQQISVYKKGHEQPLTVRNKTTPLMGIKIDNILHEFSKTKKCRVSKML